MNTLPQWAWMIVAGVAPALCAACWFGVRWLIGRWTARKPRIGSAWLLFSPHCTPFVFYVEDVSGSRVYFASYHDGESPDDCSYRRDVWQREVTKHDGQKMRQADWTRWKATWEQTLGKPAPSEPMLPGTDTITVGPDFGKRVPYGSRVGETAKPVTREWVRNEIVVRIAEAQWNEPVGVRLEAHRELEAEVEALHIDIEGVAQHIAPLNAMIEDIVAVKMRLDALEGRGARAPVVCHKCGEPRKPVFIVCLDGTNRWRCEKCCTWSPRT